MKTNLKNHKYYSSLGLVVSLTVMSCLLFNRCQGLDDQMDYNLDIPDEYKEVGASHTEGLDYIFSSIQYNCIEYSRRCDIEPMHSEVLDYSVIVREALQEFCEKDTRINKISDFYLESLQTDYFLKSRHVTDLKPEVKDFISKIQFAIKTGINNKNTNQFKKDLNSINQAATEHLSSDDAAAIYCATSTAYSSFQYWQKNYRAWYFALNYPEIMERYGKMELNQLSLKSATAFMDTIPGFRDRLKAFWDGFEGWVENTSDALDYWWDEYGEKIIISDCMGAVAGTYDALVAAGAGSLVFGPEGLVVVGAAGAIVGGIDASAFAITGSGVLELLKQ